MSRAERDLQSARRVVQKLLKRYAMEPVQGTEKVELMARTPAYGKVEGAWNIPGLGVQVVAFSSAGRYSPAKAVFARHPDGWWRVLALGDEDEVIEADFGHEDTPPNVRKDLRKAVSMAYAKVWG